MPLAGHHYNRNGAQAAERGLVDNIVKTTPQTNPADFDFTEAIEQLAADFPRNGPSTPWIRKVLADCRPLLDPRARTERMALTDRRLYFLLLAARLGAFSRMDDTYGPARGDAILAYCTSERTLNEVGEVLGVSGERARQYVLVGLKFLWLDLPELVPFGADGYLLTKDTAIPWPDLSTWPQDRGRVAHQEAALANWDRDAYIASQRKAIQQRRPRARRDLPDAQAQ